MDASKEDRFKCTSCGRRFTWKRDIAGRKVRCKCGESIRVPKSVDSQASSKDDTYELDFEKADAPREPLPSEQAAAPAHGGKCPSCAAEISKQAVICIQCGFDVKEGRQIETSLGQAVKTVDAARAARGGGAAAPVGFFGRISRNWQFAKKPADPGK
jgi:DNA-directed RNA polymerase subunit RPC12/RpoP